MSNYTMTMNYTTAKLSDAHFQRLSTYIFQHYGIKLPAVKKTLLESRLHKRLRILGIPSFPEYCDFLFSAAGQQQEVMHMIDVVTTNKTDFFREPVHFDFMKQTALPALIEKMRAGLPIKIWSAGCSSGEEAYTISMVIHEYARMAGKLVDYSILGTDISTQILEAAHQAIYTEDRIHNIPIEVKKRYFLRSKDASKQVVRIVPELRKKVNFKRLNFMDPAYEVDADFDIIFCRNVLIYFDRPTQAKVVSNLCKKLKPGGYFFLGHSESISDIQLPLQQIKPTIFQRK